MVTMVLLAITFPRLAKEPILSINFVCDPRSLCFHIFVFVHEIPALAPDVCYAAFPSIGLILLNSCSF